MSIGMVGSGLEVKGHLGGRGGRTRAWEKRDRLLLEPSRGRAPVMDSREL